MLLQMWIVIATTLAGLPATDAGPDPIPHDPPEAEAAVPWGFSGHEMAARAAADILPDGMPDFFREATDRFVYLNPEPDRWRNRDRNEMDQAFSYDHYIDLENVPTTALEASDRFTFLAALYEVGLEKPERDAGFLPFRIVELYQRIVTEWEMWHREADPERKGWIEDRILNDAGILGHYVTDGSQPHHTTIHFNGWNSVTPNPERYTEDREFHSRFERYFVDAHVTQDDVSRRVQGPPDSVAGNARAAVVYYIQRTFTQVEPLYRLDRDVGFDPESAFHPDARDFAADRLAAGAEMLAMLWWSAWLEGSPG